MSLTENDITAKNFKKFFTALSPYLGSYDKGKLTFVGEVKAFFAETAPNGFLVCDGATYNKADYPQLANLLLSLTDHSAYEVSGDDTKFKVPDLRGEFLRGSGTNSHANQGSGAGVGVHQDGTEHVDFGFDENSNSNLYINSNKITSGNVLMSTKTDSKMLDKTKTTASWFGRGGTFTGPGNYAFTSRPTNTSVLYCIAYKDTMVDLDFLSYGGERFAKSDMYDTNERVIGKWIDGRPLYQKVIHTTSASSIDLTSLNYDYISYNGDVYYTWSNNKNYRRRIEFTQSDGDISAVNRNHFNSYLNDTEKKLEFGVGTGISQILEINVIFQYTKTTDSADSFKYSTPTDYSTEEKIVGTWIDGKPLYQKTYTNLTTPSSAGQGSILSVSGISIKEIVNGWVFWNDNNDNEMVPMVGWYSSSEWTVSAKVVNQNTIIISTSSYLSKRAMVTIRYTKTTDA